MFFKGNRTCRHSNDVKSTCERCGSRNFISGRSSILEYAKQNKRPLVIACWKCHFEIHIEALDDREWYGGTPKDALREKKGLECDCIYLPYNGKEMLRLKERFPEAWFKNASDFVHPERFEIEVPNVTRKEFTKALIEEGLFDVSLGLQLAVGINKDMKSLVDEIIEELCVEHHPCIKEESWK